MTTTAAIIAVAVLLDYCIGDPVYPWHPVRSMGRLIACTDRGLRRLCGSNRGSGALLLACVWTITLLVYAVLRLALEHLAPMAAIGLDAYLLYSCIALGDMSAHIRPVARALQTGDTAEARRLVQRIVGRDASQLDDTGVALAAVESISESFVDGFFAPLFWFTILAGGAALLGVPPLPAGTAAVLAYRATNTMDSMVGYKNPTYQFFGWAAARLDDLLNFLPARLCLLVLLVAARTVGESPQAGWRIARRDRLKHASPNSAHAESFVAGALNVRLGGPTLYAHGQIDKPWLGDGPDPVNSDTVRRADRLIRCAGWVALAGTLILLLIIDTL